MVISVSAPQTPSRRPVEDFDCIIRDLNRTYNLGIDVVDLTLSPIRRKEHIEKVGATAKRVEKIHARLRREFFKDGLALDETLGRFRNEAQDICGKEWNRPPKVENIVQLQNLLLKHLDDPAPVTRSLQQVMAGSSRAPPPPKSPPKRTSSEHQRDLFSKKAKSSHDKGAGGAVDAEHTWMPTLSVRGWTSNSTPALSEASNAPNTSPSQRVEPTWANTSRTTMVSDVFSGDEGYDCISSQSTVEATPEERRRDGEDYYDAPSSPSPYNSDRNFDHGITQIAGNRSDNQEPSEHASYPILAAPFDLGLAAAARLHDLHDRLRNIWPLLPPFLNHAPLGICWEVTRIALSCNVPFDRLEGLQYNDDWYDQTKLRVALRSHPSFRGKTIPESCREDVWKASLSTFQEDGKAISLAINLSWNSQTTGPLFDVSLQPLKLDQSHRLGRRFGADRFLDINIPSPTSRKYMPPHLQKVDGASDAIVQWLATGRHFIVGRKWAAFYMRSWKKTEKDRETNKEMIVNLERIHCFAEDGHHFVSGHTLPSKLEATVLGERRKIKLSKMLDWTLSMSKPANMEQPAVKLFSRVALSLSKTFDAVVLEQHQIRHRAKDIMSPTGIVMNDGIARMSTALVKMISAHMGLTDLPSAFQGRFGSAKGLWIRDTTDLSDDIWIETYPSQRKWECDFHDTDHRAFEVKKYSRMPKSADVNLQFIVVLCAQAHDSFRMRQVLADMLNKYLEEELHRLRSAMGDPVQFYQWIHENFFQTYRPDRLKIGIDFLAGMSDKEAETVNFLLAGGFHPTKLNFLYNICWGLAKNKAEQLKETLKLRIPRSTYAYMAVDFQGVLKPGEVHFGFSSKFQVDDSPETLLHGMDVLVARSPAHYPSDIQRVKAVFRPELAMLKDVIIFPVTGDVPLADLLSGGDYDGDQAWVCWEPDIVENFRNAPAPQPVDFAKQGYLHKEKTTFGDILELSRGDTEEAVAEFIFGSFRFNMREQLLGMCATHKEKYCYRTNHIDNTAAVALSGLLSALVDQAKQGIVFTWKDWARFRKDFELNLDNLLEPAYKPPKSSPSSTSVASKPTNHVLDYLKFEVAIPKVESELKEFHRSLSADPQAWDPDLAVPSKELDAAIELTNSPHLRCIRDNLNHELEALSGEWNARMGQPKGFREKVPALYRKWVAIEPPQAARMSDHGRLFLGTDFGEFGPWAMLKASATFRHYHLKTEKFTWTMAGRQLQRIKAGAVGGDATRRGLPGCVAVVMPVFATMRPDRGVVAGAAAVREGREDGSMMGDVDWDDETGLQLDDA